MDAILNYEPSEEDDYYGILGCHESASSEQINTEYKQRVLNCHPDKHPGDSAAAARFTLLQTAKSVLTEPSEREKYDRWRLSGICMPYQQWRALRDNVHMSMHWATKSQNDLMLENAESLNGSKTRHKNNTGISPTTGADRISSKSTIPWNRDRPSDALLRFRNYQI